MSKRDAIEKLRADVAAAQAAAVGNRLWALPPDELEVLAGQHKLGTNYNGWKNPFPETDPRSLLLEYQFADFHDHSRFKIRLQSRQTGKDFTGQGEMVGDCNLRKTEWMVAAPSERQALDSLDQGKTWAEAFDLAIDSYEIERETDNPGSLLKAAEMIFSNGSKIRAVPGRPDTVRGRSTNIYLTEFDFFENAQATWRAILPSITNPLRGGEKKVRIASTPNGKGGAMNKIWTREDRKIAWSRRLVTIYHAVLMGLPVDIEALREALDDPEGFRQEFLCEFLDGASVLLPYELIAQAESIDASEMPDPAFWDNPGDAPIYLGIDFGRVSDPTVSWAVQDLGDVAMTREVLCERGVSTPDQEALLKRRVAKATRVCYDYTGPGIGLGDYLVKEFGEYNPQKHLFGKIELCTFTSGFKREIFPRLRRVFEAPTKVRVPISVAVREDLHAMQQVIRNGEYNYFAPRTSEGHSDRCTALALAIRARGEGATSFFVPRNYSRRSSRQYARSGRRT